MVILCGCGVQNECELFVIVVWRLCFSCSVWKLLRDRWNISSLCSWLFPDHKHHEMLTQRKCASFRCPSSSSASFFCVFLQDTYTLLCLMPWDFSFSPCSQEHIEKGNYWIKRNDTINLWQWMHRLPAAVEFLLIYTCLFTSCLIARNQVRSFTLTIKNEIVEQLKMMWIDGSLSSDQSEECVTLISVTCRDSYCITNTRMTQV